MAAAQPNVVVVVTDDMRDTDWQALPRTQALVADQGTRFPNFFLTTAVCSPSRASILTGMYAHRHGVTANTGKKGGFAQFKRRGLDKGSIPLVLKRSGYRTGLFGKFINGAPEQGEIPGGWDRWLVTTTLDYYRPLFNDNGEARQIRDKDEYVTDVLADAAVEFIRGSAAAEPFLLLFTPKAPHGPATPARRHRGAFAGARVGRSPDFAERDVANKPGYVRERPVPSIGELDGLEQRRLATLVAVDEAVERIVTALNDSGRLESTCIFVLSDNGETMGSHRLVGKGVPYRTASQVTMAVRGPGFGAGVVDDRLAANIDIAPTIARLAGARLPDADGISLASEERREAVLLEGQGSGNHYRALRTAEWLYVENPDDERELYHYPTDPYEIDNLLASWHGLTPSAEAERQAAAMKTTLSRIKS